MRHYKELSDRNFCIEKGFYPLGSCTMKYNPKVNELLASLEGFVHLHPLQDDEDAQGALELMYNLQEELKKITGMDAVTLQPAAGAHGELTGMMVIKNTLKLKAKLTEKKLLFLILHMVLTLRAQKCAVLILSRLNLIQKVRWI